MVARKTNMTTEYSFPPAVLSRGVSQHPHGASRAGQRVGGQLAPQEEARPLRGGTGGGGRQVKVGRRAQNGQGVLPRPIDRLFRDI